jgi:hypothetical protein
MKKILKAIVGTLLLSGVVLAQYGNVHNWLGNNAKTGTIYSHGIEVPSIDNYMYAVFRMTATPGHVAANDTAKVYLETRYGDATVNGWYDATEDWVAFFTVSAAIDDTSTVSKWFLVDSLATAYTIGQELRWKVILSDTITADTTYTGDSTWQWTSYIGFQ